MWSRSGPNGQIGSDKVLISKCIGSPLDSLRSPFWMFKVPILDVQGPHFGCSRSPLKLRTMLKYTLYQTSLISLPPNWSTDLPLKGPATDPNNCKLVSISAGQPSACQLLSLSALHLVSFTSCQLYSLSTLQLVNFTACQLYSLSTLQLVNFTACQLYSLLYSLRILELASLF